MERPSAPSWSAELAEAVVVGLATACLPVQRWPAGVRWALHGGMGLTTGAATTWLLRHPRTEPGSDDQAPPTAPRSTTASVVLGALVGTAVLGVSRGGQAADAWTERQLVSRGVWRPRLWMGLTAAAVSLASSAAERPSSPRGPQLLPGTSGGGGAPGAAG